MNAHVEEKAFLPGKLDRPAQSRCARVLINSHTFAPNVGGSESACELLIEGLLRSGYDVKVVTATPCEDRRAELVPVFRRPCHSQLLDLVRWADVVIHSNISLRAAWPLLLAPKPWIVIHHSSLVETSGRRGPRQWMKQLCALFATNIAVSKSMADSLLAKSIVVGNGFREHIFRRMPEITRGDDLIFVGRLVDSKGADLAIRALAGVRAAGFEVNLTIVGTGPSEGSLRELASELDLSEHVVFAGVMKPEGVATLLNRHRILLAPSRGTETFGIVALEALACGCMPIVSKVGGLMETVGDHGVVVPEGDVDSLTTALVQVLAHPRVIGEKLEMIELHLERFREERILEGYTKVIERVRLACPPGLQKLSQPLSIAIAGQNLLL